MTRYVALLRAINVGGHVVTMDTLKKVFRSLDFDNVETFIASGNVIFDAKSKAAATLEKTIEAALKKALGYEVATFLRTLDEVAKVAAHEPYPATSIAAARAYCVGFLKTPLDRDGERTLMSWRCDQDDFKTNGREIYWLCQTGQSDSKFTNAKFEKAAKVVSTFRGMNTVQRLTAKYPVKK